MLYRFRVLRWMLVAYAAILVLSIWGVSRVRGSGPDTTMAAAAAPQIVVRAGDYEGGLKVPAVVDVRGPGQEAPTAATINVDYSTGFPADAQTAFQYAVDIWAVRGNSTVPIEVEANWTSLGANVLGSAGAKYVWANFTNAPVANVWYPDALADKLATSDLSPGNPDIIVNMNSDVTNWYYGTDQATPAGDYDLVTVALHELAHGLGFFGSATVDGGGVGSWGIDPGDLPTIFDCFTVDGTSASANNIIDTSVYPDSSTALGTALTSGVYWGGLNATATNGGPNVELYSPATWDPGSSYSHLGESYNGTSNALMTFSVAAGESIHDPGPLVLDIFKDIGWNGVGSADPGCPSTPTAVTLQLQQVSSNDDGAVQFSLIVLAFGLWSVSSWQLLRRRHH